MLHYNTVSETLKMTLELLMDSVIFNDFRLVGGTSLSLQIGHRQSIDIDLFSDLPYGKIDFNAIDQFLERAFSVCKHSAEVKPGLGKSYVVGNNINDTVKLDIFYADPFIRPPLEIDHLRLATVEDIIAMKIDVVQRMGRKKDFWDLHALMPKFNVNNMLELHRERTPYTHDEQLIIQNFTNFTLAEGDFDPVCLQGKSWDIIKLDLIDAIDDYLKQ